jgi:hypothetical protein
VDLWHRQATASRMAQGIPPGKKEGEVMSLQPLSEPLRFALETKALLQDGLRRLDWIIAELTPKSPSSEPEEWERDWSHNPVKSARKPRKQKPRKPRKKRENNKRSESKSAE